MRRDSRREVIKPYKVVFTEPRFPPLITRLVRTRREAINEANAALSGIPAYGLIIFSYLSWRCSLSSFRREI